MAHTPALDRLWRWLRGSNTHAAQPAPPKAHTSHASSSGLRQQRSTRREQLFALVRENMIRLGVLSSHYKFKVLTLDPSGEQFIVMVDWQPGAPAGDVAFEKGYESGLQQLMDERRLGFKVKAVYWRGHAVTTATAAPMVVPASKPAIARPQAAQAPAPAPAPATPATSTHHHAGDHVSDDELQAFQAALREAGGGSRAQHRPPPLSPQDTPDFAPTVNTEGQAGTEFGSLSETQYGKLS